MVVVNESFKNRYFKERNAVGEHVFMSGQERQIVGVVANVQQRGGFNGFGPLDALPAIYMPFSQFPQGDLRTIHGWFSPAWIVREAKAGAVSEPRSGARWRRSTRSCRCLRSAGSMKC